MPSAFISVEGQIKSAEVRWRKYLDVPVSSHCSLLRNSWLNRPVCCSIVVKEKPTVGSPFFGVFPSDGMPKATEGVNVHLFILSSNSYKLYHQIPGTFWNYYVNIPLPLKRGNLFYDYLWISLSVLSSVANKSYSSKYIKQYFVKQWKMWVISMRQSSSRLYKVQHCSKSIYHSSCRGSEHGPFSSVVFPCVGNSWIWSQ